MPDTVNITVSASPVTVAMTAPAAAPVAVAITETAAPVAVAITETAAPVAVAVTPPATSPITVAVAQAPAGADGDPGANAEIVMLANLAAYLALAPEVQMDGRWYVIPK